MKGAQLTRVTCVEVDQGKDLMQENQVLRQLLRSLSNFIGDGAGGLLPKLGWDMNDFNNFVNRSETDTAWESYQRHKREEQANTSTSTSQKRPAEDDTASRAKRPRGPGEAGTEDRDGYPLLVPGNPAVPPIPAPGLYPSTSGRSQHESMFNDIMRGPNSGSPMFVPPTSPPNAQFTGSSGMSGNPYASAPYLPSMNVNVDPALPGMSLVTNPATMPAPRGPQPPTPTNKSTHTTAASPADDDQDPKRHEAYKLIQCVICWSTFWISLTSSDRYHLDNYKRNSAYCLPSSLRPTLVQR